MSITSNVVFQNLVAQNQTLRYQDTGLTKVSYENLQIQMTANTQMNREPFFFKCHGQSSNPNILTITLRHISPLNIWYFNNLVRRTDRRIKIIIHILYLWIYHSNCNENANTLGIDLILLWQYLNSIFIVVKYS